MKGRIGYIIRISLKLLICVVMTILVWKGLKKYEFFSGTSKTSATDTVSANVPKSTFVAGGGVVHKKKAKKKTKKKTRKHTKRKTVVKKKRRSIRRRTRRTRTHRRYSPRRSNRHTRR